MDIWGEWSLPNISTNAAARIRGQFTDRGFRGEFLTTADSGEETVTCTAKVFLDRDSNAKVAQKTGPLTANDLASAAAGGNAEVVRRALDQGVNPNAKDQSGKTALLAAVLAEQVEVVRILVIAGADPEFDVGSGETAKDAAEAMGASEILGILDDAEYLRSTAVADASPPQSKRSTAADELARVREEKRKKAGAERERLIQEAARRQAEAEAARKRLEEEVARLKAESKRSRQAEETARREDEAKKERERQDTELALWQGIKDNETIEGLERYLENYPSGRFFEPAQTRLDLLRKFAVIKGIEFGTYHGLVIGNNEYKHLPDLETAVGDAKVVAMALREEYGFKVNLLTNATRVDIIEALDGYIETLEERDNLLIYYAGHGWLGEDARRGYWLPVNAQESRRSYWLSNATITDTLNALRAKHVMVVADSCYSGTLTRSGAVSVKNRTADYWKRMATKRTRVVLTSGGLEPVVDKGGSGRSPFAKAFIDALRENEIVMDGTQLFTRMRRPVMVAADQTPQYSDARNAGHDGGDFLFVRKR